MITMLLRRELRSLLGQPATWWLLALLQFVFAWFFLARTEFFLAIQPQLAQLATPPGATLTIGVPVFNLQALLLLVLTPLFTMRLIAEERRNHTWPLLQSAPLTTGQIVLGKLLGLWLFLGLVALSGPLMLLTLSVGTQLDQGLLFSNTVGLLLLLFSQIALGLYCSALTHAPVVAALSTLLIQAGLWLADLLSNDENSAWHTLSPMHHFQNFNNGLLDSRDAVFFLLFGASFVLLTWRRLARS